MSNNFGRAITTYTEINTEKNLESMYKSNTKNEAKRLRAINKWEAIEKSSIW